MTEEIRAMSDSEKKKEDWMNSKWRPAMGWLYMSVCAFDFVLFPILWSLVQALHGGQVTNQWQPLTLQGAGLFHIAMGAVLGIAAFGRTQEKLNGANNGGISVPSTNGPAFGSPSAGGFGTPSSFGSPAATPSFGAPAAGPSFGAPAARSPVTQPSFTPSSTFVSSSGKPGPMQGPDPEL